MDGIHGLPLHMAHLIDVFIVLLLSLLLGHALVGSTAWPRALSNALLLDFGHLSGQLCACESAFKVHMCMCLGTPTTPTLTAQELTTLTRNSCKWGESKRVLEQGVRFTPG